MLPAANRGAGQNLGFPDVCNTPVGPATAPIPYPNIAMNAQATGYSETVKVSGMNALTLSTSISQTTGDEAGTAHPMIKQRGAYTMGNPIVSIDKMQAISLTSPTTGNNMNNPVGMVAVPSAVNVMYTFAGVDTYDRALVADDVTELARRARPAQSLEARMLDGEVGLVVVSVLSDDVAPKWFKAMRQLDGARGLVLDLRGCPGGELDAMLRLADELLPWGTEILRVRDADGDEEVCRARKRSHCALPMAVLVDSNTASAAELLAGCLQRVGRAMVMGQTTYGKATAQQVVAVPRAEQLEVRYRTTALCCLPNGDPIDGCGVTPDRMLSMRAPHRRELATDDGLQAAWSYVRTQ